MTIAIKICIGVTVKFFVEFYIENTCWTNVMEEFCCLWLEKLHLSGTLKHKYFVGDKKQWFKVLFYFLSCSRAASEVNLTNTKPRIDGPSINIGLDI